MISDRIKQLRVDKGWNQIVLAEKLEMTNQQVCLYESGTLTPALKHFINMAKMFKCQCYWLITGTKDEVVTRPAMLHLHKRIACLRTEKGWDWRQLAKKVGISRNQVYRYENGRQFPTLKRMLKLAQLFNCNFYWLATGRKEKAYK